MQPERWAAVRALFEQALDREAEEREAWVRGACGGDAALADEVLALLRTDATHAPGILDAGPGTALAHGDLVGRTVAGFRILRRIGEGGMGTVYEAMQLRPQRRVAWKTLAVRFPSERARRRFEDEADILARLRHPAIAQVFEAGSASLDGSEVPWFAMELVEDPRPLDRHVREAGLEPLAVAALFQTVCEAVHYAHQRGVIHRDLKPANVLVDRHGHAKVIDFGIARVAGDDVVERCTRTGEVLGTLAYMSPERLEGAGADDTAGDVYALGVLLYELLAGRLPFALEGLAPARVVAALREADALPLAQAAPERRIPAELEWITAKAMARSPRDRYASAGELAADLARLRSDEPLLAGPPSATYRLRKLAWRHRLALGAMAVVIVALAAGLVVAMVGWRRVAAAERHARAEAERATEANRQAQREAAVLAQVNEFQQRILRSAYGSEKGRDVRLADVVDAAARDLDRQRFTDPWVEIGVRTSIAVSYVGLGRLPDAEGHLLRARTVLADHGLDPHAPRALTLTHNLAACYADQGKLDLAERELRGVLADRQGVDGDGEAAVRARSNLAALLLKRGQAEEALALTEQVRAAFERRHGRASEEAINAHATVAQALAACGRDGDAMREFDAALASAERHLHADHPARLAVAATRAAHLHKVGRLEEALAASSAVAAARERLLGPLHQDTLAAWNNVATDQLVLKQHAAAEATFRRILAAQEQVGIRGVPFLITRQNLTVAVRRQGRAAEAEVIARDQREQAQRQLPADHWLLGVVTKEHGGCLRDLGRFAEAEPLLLAAHELLDRVAPKSPHTQKAAGELVDLYRAWDRPDAARAWEAKAAGPSR